MKEIGSFIELEIPIGKEFYHGEENIARLNTGRAAIWHAFRLTGTKTIWLPYYQCETVREFLTKKNVKIKFYHLDKDFNPLDVEERDDDAVLVVNYYGIMSNERMSKLAQPYKHAIVDCAQAFFCKPVEGALTVYSCRKFVGVPDGAYVIGEGVHRFMDEYLQGYSSDTAAFLLKRIEYGCAGKGYDARILNENRVDSEDIMKMSTLTRTILDGTDYHNNIERRKQNFRIACELFNDINKIDPTQYIDDKTVPMVYPLVVEDDGLLQRLLDAKHYQGHWWKYLTKELPDSTFEYWLSRYVIPITIDQRYGREELEYLRTIVG